MQTETLILEIIIIIMLIAANGFFASSEIAIIKCRESRIKTMVHEDRPSAKKLLALKQDPDRFLSTIQIGITLIGSLASAIGGAAAVNVITPFLESGHFGFIGKYAQTISIALVVLTISYFTLIIGELVPKTLGIRFSEKIALFVSGPILFLSKLAYPVVKLMTLSNQAVLSLFGLSRGSDFSHLTQDEIRLILKEGEEKGVIDETEHQLIHSIFNFADRSVWEVMVPHPNIQAIDIEWKKNDVLRFATEKGLTRYPVFEGDRNNVIGVLNTKDILDALVSKKPFKIRDLIHPPVFIPEPKQVSELLKEMQKTRTHLALVVDEYGDVIGLVTMEDLLEEIVGEIEDEHDGFDKIVKKYKDGTMIVDGSASIRDLINIYNFALTDSDDYETIAGLILASLGSIPKGGEVIRHEGYKFTVVDVEKNRIAKVKVERERKGLKIKERGTAPPER